MAPDAGAGIARRGFLTDTHPAAPPPEATEAAGGKYTVGPIKFDAPGNWTVRFHFYEECNDAPEDSPTAARHSSVERSRSDVDGTAAELIVNCSARRR